MGRGFRPRRKICTFCADKSLKIDYKDINRLSSYVNDRGRILPRRATGNCAKHQRKIAKAVERARQIALLPYSAD